MNTLVQLRAATEERSRAIVARYPDWPCRKGCDHCCRSLAGPLELTQTEWREVEAGFALLPETTRAEVNARWAAPSRTCPFLDPAHGDCLIYEHRPIACRAYGFYVDERGIGLYCGIIRGKVDAGEFAEAVWGNHSALESRLAALDPSSAGLAPQRIPVDVKGCSVGGG